MLDHSELLLRSELHMNLLVLIGVAIFVGTIGTRIFRKIEVPQVVGCIVAGLIVGEGWLKLLTEQMINDLSPINYFALGMIAFMIGGELKADNFTKYRKQFIAMVIAEGTGAFICVSVLAGAVVWSFTHDATLTLVLGLIIGAISSATDPFSTLQVFNENRTRGALTTAVTAIVALNDGLALILFVLLTSIASFIAAGQNIDLMRSITTIAYGVFGSLGIGVIAGLLLAFNYKVYKRPEKLLPYTLGLIPLLTGIALFFKFDIILAPMAFGVTLVNFAPLKSNETFDLVKRFAPPIYVLFFVFVGARLHFASITLMIAVLIIVYVIGRSIGKVISVYLAAKASGASEKVQKYSGMCLFTQAGIAVGLSLVASQHFEKEIGDIIVTLITVTTFILQIIGPLFVKLAVTKANELNLNITEADLVKMYTVNDVMDKTSRIISQLTPLSEIMALFSERDETVYFIANRDGDLVGYVTLDGVRAALNNHFLSSILIADDVMFPVRQTVTPGDDLEKALGTMANTQMDFIPVVVANDSSALIGILVKKDVDRMIAAELLKCKELAEKD
jgi:Kef-type K+ transport system membrane component KefB